MPKTRFDASGFLWDDPPGYRPEVLGPMPPIPDTGWKPPTEFPNLSAAKAISLDCETWDPELREAGPGWARGKGHIVGVSLAARAANGEIGAWYFPMRHEVQPEDNMDPQQVLRFLSDPNVLANTKPKVGANIYYDVGWMKWEGVPICGPYYDIQYAEALLDSETPNVSLDALAWKYLNEGKQTDWLKEWAIAYYKKKEWRANIYRCPPRLVGYYGEGDARQPLQIADRQWPLLEQRGVAQLFLNECKLIPMLVDMRMEGAAVNVAKAEEIHEELGHKLDEKTAELSRIVGFEFNPNSGPETAKAFDALGYPYPRGEPTESNPLGSPSFRKEWLEAQPHDLAEAILEWRALAKVRGTFIEGYILNKNINGRIFCSFHPLKSDEGGARSGRFASSDPNLQNIPVRSKLGKRIRQIFGDELFSTVSIDYSQIEYRMLAHFAVGPGSDEIRLAYNNDPTLDYHDITIELIYDKTGIRMERKPAKNINFGLIYGMGKDKLARSLKLAMAQALELMDAYHKGVPFAKPTMELCAKEIDETGMVRTISNRASDFPLFVPVEWQANAVPMPFEDALRKYGPVIHRAHKHKGLNRKLQGSAADVMKNAMVALYESGILDVVGIPSITVHDELVWTARKVPPTHPAWREVKRIMEETTRIRVPIIADMDYGPSWGDADTLEKAAKAAKAAAASLTNS